MDLTTDEAEMIRQMRCTGVDPHPFKVCDKPPPRQYWTSRYRDDMVDDEVADWFAEALA